MALTHLRFEIEAGRGPAGSAALLNSRRVATPALLGGLAALATLASWRGRGVLHLSRVTIGGMRRASRASPVAGLGDRVDLSRAGTVADDPRVALRVRLDPPPPGEPRDLGMHWRARSLSRWTGQGWQAQEGGSSRRRGFPTAAPRSSPALLSADVEVVERSRTESSHARRLALSVDFRRPGPAPPPPPRRSGSTANAAGTFSTSRWTATICATWWRSTGGCRTSVPYAGRGQRYAAWLAPDLAVPPELDARRPCAGAAARRGQGPRRRGRRHRALAGGSAPLHA